MKARHTYRGVVMHTDPARSRAAPRPAPAPVSAATARVRVGREVSGRGSRYRCGGRAGSRARARRIGVHHHTAVSVPGFHDALLYRYKCQSTSSTGSDSRVGLMICQRGTCGPVDISPAVRAGPTRDLLGGCYFSIGAVDLECLAAAIELDHFHLVLQLITIAVDLRFFCLATRARLGGSNGPRQRSRRVLDSGGLDPGEQLLELLVLHFLHLAGVRI